MDYACMHNPRIQIHHGPRSYDSRVPTVLLDDTATTVIPAAERSAPCSVRSARDLVDSAKTDEEIAHATAILRQGEELWRNGEPVYRQVSEAPSPGLKIQAETSAGGQNTAPKRCLSQRTRKSNTTAGQ
jgi:hypothetical protein